nr:RHS repeat-associated core domain-containing protein [Lacrimispora sp.]
MLSFRPGNNRLNYDKNGSVTELTDVTGIATRYTYDVLNRVREVRDSQNHTFLAAYQYTPEGRISSLDYGNGVKTEYQYQDDGLIEHLVTVGSDGKILLNYAYAYDGNGNCTKKSGDVYQNAYGYDVMNRLSEATYHGDTEQFTYDLAGNRLTRKTQTGEERYEYNRKNQLTGLETESDHMVYLYDKQGNLLSEQGKEVSRTYAYDPLNRQYSVTTENGAASYRYDGEGLRYETEEAGKVIRFVFDRGELAAEESGLEQKRYCRGHHVVSLQSAGEDSPNYFVCDEMGSTIFLLDQEQEIRKSYHYDPFGSIIETSGSIENRITYTGQMYDGISGQYYLRARFYNPKIGRFMQEDAYRGDGLNLYAYCQNNPITYYDPSGYMGLCPAGKNNPQAEQTEGTGDGLTGSNWEFNPQKMSISEVPEKHIKMDLMKHSGEREFPKKSSK